MEQETTFQYPPYDERLYAQKVKEKYGRMKIGALIYNTIIVTVMLCGSVIGLIVCWVPALLFSLYFIFGIPVSITVRRVRAYKLYIEDCKKQKETRIRYE